MKSLKRIGALLMCGTLLLSSCGDKEESGERMPVAVKTEEVVKEEIIKKNDFMGRVMPDSTVFIIPKVPGEVTSINVEVGDEVKKGQVLFEIDSTIDALQLEQAAAAVEMAKAGLEQATGATYEQQLLQLQGQVDMAQSQKKWTDKTYDDYDDTYDANTKNMLMQLKQAEKAEKEIKKLYDTVKALPDGAPLEPIPNILPEGGVVSDDLKTMLYDKWQDTRNMRIKAESAYDNFVNGYEAQYNQLTQGLEQVEIGLGVAEKAYELATGEAHEEQLKTINAQLKQAEAAYKMALQKLSYSSVTSPIDGIVEKKSVELHGFASQSEPAFIVTDKSSVNVTFGVSGENANNMRVGDPVTVYNAGKEYPATIVEVSSFIDMQSGLYTVKASVENKDGEIMSGSSVKLTAATDSKPKAVVIPADALYNENNESHVFIEEEGLAKKVKVTTGIITSDKVEITSGLKGGEKIITTWNPGLIDGAPVEVEEEEI